MEAHLYKYWRNVIVTFEKVDEKFRCVQKCKKLDDEVDLETQSESDAFGCFSRTSEQTVAPMRWPSARRI